MLVEIYSVSKKWIGLLLRYRALCISVNCAQVTDFGLSKALDPSDSVYKTTSGASFPIRWTAPEVFFQLKLPYIFKGYTEHEFTEKSDVWRYPLKVCFSYKKALVLQSGRYFLLLSYLTKVSTAYKVFLYLAMSNEQVMKEVQNGYRLPCPPGCPPQV